MSAVPPADKAAGLLFTRQYVIPDSEGGLYCAVFVYWRDRKREKGATGDAICFPALPV